MAPKPEDLVSSLNQLRLSEHCSSTQLTEADATEASPTEANNAGSPSTPTDTTDSRPTQHIQLSSFGKATTQTLRTNSQSSNLSGTAKDFQPVDSTETTKHRPSRTGKQVPCTEHSTKDGDKDSQATRTGGKDNKPTQDGGSGKDTKTTPQAYIPPHRRFKPRVHTQQASKESNNTDGGVLLPSSTYQPQHTLDPYAFATALTLNATPQLPRPPLAPRSQLPAEAPPPPPKPSETYLQQASPEPKELKQGRRLLIVLDLNGTLLHRPKGFGSTFKARPRVKEFLHYLFTNHHVMVWSSAVPRNVKDMCKKLLTEDQMNQLVACWGRDKLRLSQTSYREKVQVHKHLTWIWTDEHVRAKNMDLGDCWSQANTVLIDDSKLKAASEPFNLVQLEEFEGKLEQMRSDVLGQVVKYLETLRFQSDVSAYIRRGPFTYDAEGSFDWTSVVRACDLQQSA